METCPKLPGCAALVDLLELKQVKYQGSWFCTLYDNFSGCEFSFTTRSKIRTHFSAYIRIFTFLVSISPKQVLLPCEILAFEWIENTENKAMKIFLLTSDCLYWPVCTALFICRSWVVIASWAALTYSSPANYLATSHVSPALPDNCLAGVPSSLQGKRKPYSLYN